MIGPETELPTSASSRKCLPGKAFLSILNRNLACNGRVFGWEEDSVCDGKRKEAGGGVVGMGTVSEAGGDWIAGFSSLGKNRELDPRGMWVSTWLY